MKPILFVLALVLVAVLAVWYGRSGAGTHPGPGLAAPAASAEPSSSTGKNTKLESEAAQRAAVADPAAKPAAGATGAKAGPPAPQLIDPGLIVNGHEGEKASDATRKTGASAYEVKYAGASKEELEAALGALRLLYEENSAGREPDKQGQFTAEGLAELAREITWLKNQVLDGG